MIDGLLPTLLGASAQIVKPKCIMSIAVGVMNFTLKAINSNAAA
jgi:hypothetical protein